jgi:hypothetical protein
MILWFRCDNVYSIGFSIITIADAFIAQAGRNLIDNIVFCNFFLAEETSSKGIKVAVSIVNDY